MASHADHDTLKLIYMLIDHNPGITTYKISRLLALSDSAISSRLVTMDNNGYLITEDEHGGLYPFANTNREKVA